MRKDIVQLPSIKTRATGDRAPGANGAPGNAQILQFIRSGLPQLELGEGPPSDHPYQLIEQTLAGLPVQLAVVDPNVRVVVASGAWKKAARALAPRGDPAHEADALAFLTTDHRDAEWLSRKIAEVLRGKRASAKLSFTTTHGKRHRRFKLRVAQVWLGRTRGAMIVNEDVTELHELNRDRRQLIGQLLRSEELERGRIAREMHDSTVQDLVAIGLNLRRLTNLACDPDSLEALSEIRAILARTQEDVRTMSYLLHPPLLDEGGLVLALSSLIRGLSDRMKIRIEFHTDVGEDRLSAEAEMTLYRVAQEALINVHKHASATYAVVHYFREADEIVLHVEDDGLGIGRPHAGRLEVGVGIPGMRARLRRLGGTLTLSQLKVGTSLIARIPASAMVRA